MSNKRIYVDSSNFNATLRSQESKYLYDSTLSSMLHCKGVTQGRSCFSESAFTPSLDIVLRYRAPQSTEVLKFRIFVKSEIFQKYIM